jgi:hypothetical protein
VSLKGTGPGIDFGSAKSSPGNVSARLNKIFQQETPAMKTNYAAQLHQAANHGTSSPLIFLAKTSIGNPDEFLIEIPGILGELAELVSAISDFELVFRFSPNEFRYFGGADAAAVRHVGVLAAHRQLGPKRTVLSQLSPILFLVCSFEFTQDLPSCNNLVFQIHSTPVWPTGDRNRPLSSPELQQNNKMLFQHYYHINRPEFQLNLQQLNARGSSKVRSDLESSFEDSDPSIDASSENEEEIEVCCVLF